MDQPYHLVRADSVDVAVSDVSDIDVLSERSHSAATRPVAVDVLDEDILRRRLDRNAFILEGVSEDSTFGLS